MLSLYGVCPLILGHNWFRQAKCEPLLHLVLAEQYTRIHLEDS